MSRALVLLFFFGGVGLSFLFAQSTPSSCRPVSAVPASRIARLRHGINATERFAQVYDKRGYTKEHLQNWTTADDITLIKSMGFDHVRLSVDPQPMMLDHRPDEIPAEYLGYLDAAVKMILNQRLAVVIDLHPTSDFKAAVVPDAVDRLAVIRYGQDHWDAACIDAEIAQVAEWSRQRGVSVVCNEFGVYREYVDPRDRAAWVHDVRAALERYGMGWTMWDYSGSFGVVTKQGWPEYRGRDCPERTGIEAAASALTLLSPSHYA